MNKIIEWWQENSRVAYLAYGALTLAIMGPLLLPGFILTLDMVFVPNPPLPQSVSNSFVLDAAIHYLSTFIPGDIVQKVLLSAIIFFSAVGMHKLVAYVRPKSLAHEWPWVPWFAGLFYIVNPFVYERFMAGQYKVLLGYMLLPFIVKAALKFLARPQWGRLWPLTLLVVLVGIFSVHVLGFAAIILLIMVIVSIWRQPTKQYMLEVAKWGSLGVLGMLLLSSYWLVPAMLGHGDIAASVAGFDTADTNAFATDGGLFGVLQLQGFWLEAQGLFMPAEKPLPLSGLWQLALWAVIVTGAIVAWKVQRPIAIIFVATSIVAVILALGTPLNDFLSSFVPFFAGYREPQKFVALLALSYAYFGAFGVAALLHLVADKFQQMAINAVVLVLLLLPILNAPTMIWGFYGQLTPRQYPADWHAMDQELQKLGDDKHILFLPWHLYMQFSFSKRIIANPAEKFFDAPIIASNDPEYAGISPETSDEMKAKLTDEILPNAGSTNTLGQQLAALDIGYILLSKEEKDQHAYLDQQTDLTLVTDMPNLKLYKVGGGHD